VSAVCFCEMWVSGMCNLSWFGTVAVVGDVGFSVSKMFSESVGTVVVGGVDGAVVV
jgi:hypothetical protein